MQVLQFVFASNFASTARLPPDRGLLAVVALASIVSSSVVEDRQVE
jgi:hypothetical protein